jgi:hypothetical protein
MHRRRRLAAITVLAIVASMASPGPAKAENVHYKLTYEGHAIYGNPVDSTHFRTCANIVIAVPRGSAITRVPGSCPGDGSPLTPFAGHGKLKTPKPRRTPS